MAADGRATRNSKREAPEPRRSWRLRPTVMTTDIIVAAQRLHDQRGRRAGRTEQDLDRLRVGGPGDPEARRGLGHDERGLTSAARERSELIEPMPHGVGDGSLPLRTVAAVDDVERGCVLHRLHEAVAAPEMATARLRRLDRSGESGSEALRWRKRGRQNGGRLGRGLPS